MKPPLEKSWYREDFAWPSQSVSSSISVAATSLMPSKHKTVCPKSAIDWWPYWK